LSITPVKIQTTLVFLCGMLFAASIHASDVLQRSRALQKNNMAALALAELEERKQELVGVDPVEAALLKASLERDSGLYVDARKTYRQIFARENLSENVSASELRSILSWARDQEFNSLQEQAASQLAASGNDDPETILQLALHKMAFDQHQEAADMLSVRRLSRPSEPFAVYNRAVALMAVGRVYEGRRALEELLDSNPRSELDRELYDQIYLSLGYHFLSYNQGDFAQKYLSKVDSAGPRAEKALLGLGWAEISPGGSEPLCRTAGGSRVCWIDLDAKGKEVHSSKTNIEETFSDLRALVDKGKNPKELKRRIVKALQSWDQIPAEHPFNNVRQEALVARAYALSVLEPQAAIGYYRFATDVLRKEQNVLRAMEWKADRSNGQVIPPNAPDNRKRNWTNRLAAAKRASQVLVASDSPEPVQQRLKINNTAYQEHIGKLAGDYLAQDTERTTQYLRQARQGLALQLELLLKKLEG
jgi:tetratricopeptide (TPR) repeat protein